MNSDKQKQIMLSKLLSKLNNLIKKKKKENCLLFKNNNFYTQCYICT